jgi:hypothetical protein
MRQSSTRPCANGGWLHPIGAEPIKLPPKQAEPPKINATQIMEQITAKEWPEMQERLSRSLGVSLQSLSALGCAWAITYHAWAFPMKSGEGETVGIRLRNEQGRKWAWPGSREGLFIPFGQPQSTVLLVEGPTDCAAALTMGYYAIGRPSCRGSVDHTRHALKRLRVSRVVIIADNDDPGADGALALARTLCIPVAMIVLPAKDMRDYLRLGGTPSLLDNLIETATWKNPTATSMAVPL